MRVLIIMDPGIPIPPPLYGGHERLVASFMDEYIHLGHDVCLMAGPDSKAPKSFLFGRNDLNRSRIQRCKELFTAWSWLFNNRNNFDLVHNFGRLAYLLPIINHPVRKIMTYGREVSPSNIYLMNQLPTKNLIFTAPSDDCVDSSGRLGHWETVYNAIDFARYTPVYTVPKDAPLIFLGRLERVKGCHVAIEVAKRSNNKLIIAGNVSTIPEEIEYFKNEIEPFIDDEQIVYVGPVNDQQKNQYLRSAKALLFPIDIREAFGMVMAESMACGTPVIGYSLGAVPEVIVNSVNGYVVKDMESMITAVGRIEQIDRAECRRHAEKRFDVRVVARKYLSLFSL